VCADTTHLYTPHTAESVHTLAESLKEEKETQKNEIRTQDYTDAKAKSAGARTQFFMFSMGALNQGGGAFRSFFLGH
jgi:hypothetical protein